MILRIQEELKKALVSKQERRKAVLRMALTALTNESISKGAGYTLSLTEAETVMQRLVRSRQDSVEQFIKGGRQDLAQIETEEIGVLEEFLPRQISNSELEIAVTIAIESLGATSRKDMGAVMSTLKASLGSTFDAKKASQLVMSKLQA